MTQFQIRVHFISTFVSGVHELSGFCFPLQWRQELHEEGEEEVWHAVQDWLDTRADI